MNKLRTGLGGGFKKGQERNMAALELLQAGARRMDEKILNEWTGRRTA